MIIINAMEIPKSYRLWFIVYALPSNGRGTWKSPAIKITEQLEEISIWINDNLNPNNIVFNVFSHAFLFKNEEDCTAFLLRWS